MLVAKWWATDGGQRVVHRTQHVHGGIGVDTDYPVHRHLLWGKQIAATLGGAELRPGPTRRAARRRGRGGRMTARGHRPRATTAIEVGDGTARAHDPADPHPDRGHRHRHPRLPGRAPRPGAGAVTRGSKDVFMNILTTNGLVGRFVTDWAGPHASLRRVAIRLGAPNYPGDVMTMTGEVVSKSDGLVAVKVRGVNSLGDHATGTVTVAFPDRTARRGRLMASARSPAPPPSSASAPPNSPRTPAAASCSWRARRSSPRSPTPASTRPRSTACRRTPSETNGEVIVARNCGLGELKFFSRIHYGGGAACATVQQAAMAVATGVADVVVCYRAFNERSGVRYGLGQHDRPMDSTADRAAYAWMTPQGLSTPAQWVAMFARRYMHQYGATSEDFGRVAVVARKHAANNPTAWFYERPITLEDHQNSRWIAEPLHLLDCCQETDGGQALVVVSAERAKTLGQQARRHQGRRAGRPAKDQHMMTSYYRPDITGIPEMGLVGRQLYAQCGLTPDDIDAAILYDHFTPLVLPQLEELGFCEPGEAKDFIRDGNLEIGGRLPANTHGGQIGEAYLHGVNGIAEGCGCYAAPRPTSRMAWSNVLVTAGTAVPTSALILGVE